MATQSGASSSPHQRWRPAPQAAEEHKKEEEENRKFNAAKTSYGPRSYQPQLGPFVTVLRKPSVNKTGSAGESERGPSTSTRRGTDNATEATTHVPLSSTKASSAGTNSFAQHPASERTSSYARDSQSTTRTTTSRTDSSSNSPRSTSSIPPRRTEPTPPRTPSTGKATRSQKATVESDVDEDATDSEVEKGSNRPPASTTHKPVSSKAVVDDSSSSEQKKEEPMLQEREHRPYSQPYVNERIILRPPGNTTPTSDDTPSTRQEMEFNNDKLTPEVQAQRESFRQMQEEERQRDQARARELQEQREREKKRQEMEARDRELAKQLQEAEQRKHFQQMREAEKREGLRQKQEAEQRERSRQRREDESRDRAQRMKKEQEESARRAEEVKSRYQERKRSEDDERWRRATGASSSSRTPYSGGAGGGTSSFPRSPPPFGSFGSASPASFSSAGSASTQDVAAAWEKYDKAWAALKKSDAQASLRWRDIPWPMVAQPSKYEDLVKTSKSEDLLVKKAIANFVLSPTHKSRKERIREELLRWHPDRFESRWLPKCDEKDREEIKEGAGFVVRCLNELMSVDGAFGSPP